MEIWINLPYNACSNTEKSRAKRSVFHFDGPKITFWDHSLLKLFYIIFTGIILSGISWSKSSKIYKILDPMNRNTWKLLDIQIHNFNVSQLLICYLVNENSLLEAEVRSLQRKLIKRDGQILKQERELHKLKVDDVGDGNIMCSVFVYSCFFLSLIGWWLYYVMMVPMKTCGLCRELKVRKQFLINDNSQFLIIFLTN